MPLWIIYVIERNQLKLKVLFICGSLEPGHDGVGDYTRRLAGELIRKGNECVIISLNDKSVAEVITEKQVDENLHIVTHRLPRNLPWKIRTEYLKDLVQEYDPNWISLQYVPFAYHHKGLPYLFSKRILKSIFGRNLHMMFHELWVDNENLKLRILSLLQKYIIHQTVGSLKPAIIHTHLPRYFKNLQTISPRIYTLPLFSNFKIQKELQSIDTGIFTIAFFNLISDKDEVIDFLRQMETELKEMKIKMEILLIGGATKKLEAFKDLLSSRYLFTGKISCSGFVDADNISAILQSCSLGITPLSSSFIGKSGTSIAFLSNGVPLAVPIWDNIAPPFFNTGLEKALLRSPNLNEYKLCREAAIAERRSINIDLIAENFIHDLDSYGKKKHVQV